MAATFHLQRGLDEFYLCRKLEDCAGAGPGAPKAVRFYERISALSFIRGCITDPELERKLELWLQTVPNFPYLTENEYSPLLERIADRMVSGNVIVGRLQAEGAPEGEGILRASGGSTGKPTKSQRLMAAQSTPLKDEMAKRAMASKEDVIVLGEPEAEPVTTWIEIELVDADGKPAANERYKLTLPDGSTKWGRLNSAGKARVEKLQEGNCQVTFPDRDQQIWDVG